MCTIHAKIKKYESKPTANVFFRIKDGKNVDINYTSDIIVESVKWDNEIEGYPRKEILSNPEKEEANQLILQRIKLVKQVYESNKYMIVKPSTSWITDLVEKSLLQIKEKSILTDNCLLNEFDSFIEVYIKNKKRKSHFITVRNSFQRFQVYLSMIKNADKVLTFYDINYEILSLYKIFLEDENDLCRRYSIECGTRKSISNSRKGTTINGYLKKLKTFIFHYKKLLKESYNPFVDFKIDSDIFGKPMCLTNYEFYYLLNFKLDNHRLQKIKDIFVLNCLTSFRVSDFFNLSHSDIINNKIEFYPSKTSKYEIMVEVPLIDTAKEIIAKYKCDSNYIVPRMSLKTYNKGLKELFETIGLDRMVTYLNSETKQAEHAPLYEKVSSHFARRTFISLLVNSGVSDRIICSMTGHKPHSREISRYYTIDEVTQRNALNSLNSKFDFSDLFNNNGDLFQQLKTI